MAHFKYLILSFAFISNLSIAGYAQLKPPPTWSQGMTAAVPGHVGNFNFGSAANGSSYKGGTVLTNAALNVAGQVVQVPAAMRFAANAASFGATYAFGNPAVFAALAVGSLAYQWFADKGLTVEGNTWVKTTGDAGWYHRHNIYGLDTGWIVGLQGQPDGACSALRGLFQAGASEGTTYTSFVQYSECVITRNSPGYTGVAVRDVASEKFVESVKKDPATLSDLVTGTSGRAVPDGVPDLLPQIDWPVEKPVLNPDPTVIPAPAPSPALNPRPLFVPTGNPVPNPVPEPAPNPAPAPYKQPGVRVSPAPTPSEPWRVDVVPEDLPQQDADPKTAAELNPSVPLPRGTLKPAETPGLCDLYPDILACQKLDEAKDTTLETKDKAVTITPDSGWGSGGGSCPAGRTLSHGAVYSFQPLCDFASGVKPVLIAVAWFGAALLLIGAKGGSD
jgi:hypothetical protein